MTRFYAHRVNDIEGLRRVPPCWGVEVDLRSWGPEVIVNHEPLQGGPRFEDWLKEYKHAGLILNIKEEGLEPVVSKLVAGFGISEYFFLDQTFPFLFKTVSAGNPRTAVRVSDLEGEFAARSLAKRVDWCWLDGFDRPPGDGIDIPYLRTLGYRLCLASPELHGGDPAILIPPVRDDLKNRNLKLDAICTKRPDLWDERG